MRIILLLTLLCGALASSQFTAKDMHELPRLGDFAVSASGKHVVASVSQWSEDTNKFTTVLYYVDMDSSMAAKPITTPADGSASSPVFGSKDNQIAFLSDITGVRNIFTLELDNLQGGIQQVSDFPIDVDNLKWYSDGSLMAFTAEVYPGMTLAETADEDKRRSQLQTTGQMFTDTFVRHWAEWSNGKWSHVFVSQFKQGMNTGQDVMTGFTGHCPSQPFGDKGEFGFSPDGSQIAFSVLNGTNKAWRTDHNVYLSTIATGATTCVTCGNSGRDVFAAFSPAGDTIATLSNKINGYESDKDRVVLWHGDECVWLTEQWDRSVSTATWLNDTTMVVTVEDTGAVKLFYLGTSGAYSKIEGIEGSVLSVTVNNDALLCSVSSWMSPADIVMVSSDGVSHVTNLNQATLSHKTLVKPVSVWYKGANDDMVMGYYFPPINTDKPIDLIMYIHGGPEGAWDNEWSTRWNPQVMVNQGYALFAPNIHGSTGYGVNFTGSIRRNWGGWPFDDIMIGISEIVSKYDYLSSDRVLSMGASYGGYSQYWLQSHAPAGTFKAIMAHDGLFDLQSFWASTDELYFPEAEFGGPYYAVPDQYEMWSPSNFVEDWKFPMMVVHGGHDYRIPLSQGLGAFQAAQRRGLESQFLYFPTASHFVLAPVDSIMWHAEIFKWFARFE